MRHRPLPLVVAAAAAIALAGTVGPAPAQAEPFAGGGPSGTITVSAASSLTDVLPVIATAFQRKYPGTTVRFNFGGSPSLVEQVNAGAPVDVLITASEPSMAKAVAAGTVRRPLLIATNTMAIAVPPGNPPSVPPGNPSTPEIGGVVTIDGVPYRMVLARIQ